MKQLKYFFLAALLLIWGCQGKNGGTDDIVTLGVSPSELAFSGQDNSVKFVSVTTKTAWTATVSESWVHLKNASGTGNGSFSVSVDAFSGTSERSAGIIVKAGEKSATVTVLQGAGDAPVAGQLVPQPAIFDGTKLSSTTYQLLIYSFADSDGDGVGDFKGIQNKLDYLDGLGVTALWLSPAHPTSSYHAYDVNDYYSLNPLYAVGEEKTSAKAEEDFKDLIKAAHDKGIAIYMDYVLNHSGKHNAWFQEALADPSSKYRDYYFFSSNPSADYKSFPMLQGTSYQSGEWKQVTSGSPKLTITKTTEAVTNGSASWNLWMWQDGGEGKVVKFTDKGDGTYYMNIDINGKWGILVRKYNNWDAGSKFGALSGGTITEGQPMDLVGEGADMWFTGSGRYKIELTNVSTETLFYMGCFSDWMPDLNYGDVSVAENNACFQDLAASADKWINMGIDGLRLDAVKHICGGINSYNNSANQTLLDKWYKRCNATYKAASGSLKQTEDIFMVAEAWDGHNIEKSYYKGITSCFEFDYGYKVRDMLNSQNASGFAMDVAAFVTDHTVMRPDAITSFFLSNHDQDRFGSNVNKDIAKMKQAGAILLSGGGKPFIYQGEELGYYGTKGSGDEYVRTPMMWDKAGKECARKGVENKVDDSMLKAEISVEAQNSDEESILNVYRTWSRLRNTYPALATGSMSTTSITGTSIASWYMTAGSQKLLVIHNVANSRTKVAVTDSMDKPVAVLGQASAVGGELTLGGNSSVVFEL